MARRLFVGLERGEIDGDALGLLLASMGRTTRAKLIRAVVMAAACPHRGFVIGLGDLRMTRFTFIGRIEWTVFTLFKVFTP